ncbi:MAG TPA: hypothetical protein VF937_11255 [Chloroflexota bacterium]
MPARRDVNFALNLTLPTLLIVSFISGWMASMMGLTEFGLHKYSSIAAFVTAGGHLVLHRRSLMGQIRHRRNGGRETLASRPELRLLSQAVNLAATPAVASSELRPTGT